MKLIPSLLLICLLFSVGCQNDDETAPPNPLSEVGILGQWEIQQRSYGGIAPLLPFCCQFFEFKDDEAPDDLTGLYKYEGDIYTDNNEGTFTIDLQNTTILLEREDKQFLLSYQIDSTSLTLNYDEGGVEIEEVWRKLE
ncbi:MAG: hypothetical protein AAFZ15_13475 [Bacteroidota bacterium]